MIPSLTQNTFKEIGINTTANFDFNFHFEFKFDFFPVFTLNCCCTARLVLSFTVFLLFSPDIRKCVISLIERHFDKKSSFLHHSCHLSHKLKLPYIWTNVHPTLLSSATVPSFLPSQHAHRIYIPYHRHPTIYKQHQHAITHTYRMF